MARSSSRRLRNVGARTRPDLPPPLPGRDQQEEERPVDTLVFVMVSLLGLLALIIVSVIFGIQSVEDDLERQATERLQDAGLNRLRVQATGRDLLVQGDVSDAARLETINTLAATLEGAGTVTIDVRVFERGGEPIVDITPETLQIEWDTATVTIQGDVSDSATRQSLLGVLRRSFRGSVQSDGLRLLEGIPSESSWLAAVVSVVQAAGETIDAGEMTINPSGVVAIAGQVDSRQERSDFIAGIEQELAAVGFEFVSGVTIKEAPPPPRREQVIELQENLDDLIEGKVVEFEVGLDVITPIGEELLNEVFDAIQRFPDVPIEIAGHADSQGSADANLDLSLRRARAVLAYLVARGADSGRFVVNGYGETRPIADNTTEEGRQRNRRIEFTALED